MPNRSSELNAPTMAVLQKFRVIYGSMRRHFRDIEDRCGLPASQVWVLQEVQNSPGIGITELSQCIGVHQSTCSQLVEKLEAKGLMVKQRKLDDQRRVGLHLSEQATAVLGLAPGPFEGVLPQALQGLTDETLEQLHFNLAQVIAQLTDRDEHAAERPLSDL